MSLFKTSDKLNYQSEALNHEKVQFVEESDIFSPPADEDSNWGFYYLFALFALSLISGLLVCFIAFLLSQLQTDDFYRDFATNDLSKLSFENNEVQISQVYTFDTFNYPQWDDYSAKSILIWNLDSNQEVYSKNPDQRTLIASLTKIVSVYTVYPLINLKEEIVISEDLMKYNGSALELKEGQSFTKLDLLEATIIASSNQAVYAIYDTEILLQKMNYLAKVLNANDSNFTNPAGYDDNGNNYSTANDLVSFAKLFFSNESLRILSDTPRSKITDLSTGEEIEIISTNDLITMPYPEEGVIGGKTGTTRIAGQNLLLLYQKNGKTYLIIILNSIERYEDAFKIFSRL